MEKFRSIVNSIFIFLVIIGTIALIIALMGGAFPISISAMEQTVKFDLAHIGWQPLIEGNGTMEIDYEEKAVGWGSLKYSYPEPSKGKPGFYCDNIVMESLSTVSFYMKAEKPTTYAIQIKRESNDELMYKTFRVGTEWEQHRISFDDIKMHMNIKGKIPPNDFHKWVAFVDLTPQRENTIWFDHFHIIRW